MPKLKLILIRSICRIHDLALKSRDIGAGLDTFKGLMLALTVIYEETTGCKLQNGGLTVKDVDGWARSVREKEDIEIPLVN